MSTVGWDLFTDLFYLCEVVPPSTAVLSASGSVHMWLGNHVMCLYYRNTHRTEKLSEQKLQTLIGPTFHSG
jgi:hypothetical protein